MNKILGKLILIFFLIGFLLMNPVLSVLASPIVMSIQKATEYLQQENFNEAIKELETALALIRQKANLEFNKVQFVKNESQGYGLYQPRENSIFSSGETFFIYGEPKNYTIKQIEQDLYEIYLKEDFYILDKENNILFGQIDFFEFRTQSRSPNSEIIFTNTITQEPAFPPGEYKFRLVLKDVYSQRVVEITLDFEIR